jgi:hypothetical protein
MRDGLFECAIYPMSIVRGAEHPQVVGIVFAAHGEGLDVIEFEVVAAAALFAGGPHVAAAMPVTFEDIAAHGGRDVAGGAVGGAIGVVGVEGVVG